MKKLYFIMTLIFMSLMASCSQEEIANRETENKRVSISAEFPGNIASTRASISIPATHKLRCIIEVWEAEKNPELKYRNEMTVEGGVVAPTFDFALKPGEYNCLIWADLIKKDAVTSEVTIGDEVTYTHFEDTYYDTSDLNSVKVKDAKALFDTDLCDGFFMSMQLKKSDTPVQKVVKLVRPFAKLIVKENETEKFVTLQKISVSYEMPEAFNVATGEPTAEKVSGLYEKTFTSGDVSRILFTSYRFVPSTETTVSSSMLSFKTAAGTIRCEIPGDVITLKRNQQMTAGGNLISGGGIEPEPEPEPSGEDPQIGDYFFIDGTWSSELTDDKKDDCVGLVYAVGGQQGDNIDNYPNSTGKTIKGYVVSLKALTPTFEVTNDHGYPTASKMYPRLFLYNKQSQVALSVPSTVDRSNHNGYLKTQELLASEQFEKHQNDKYYPALQCFNCWIQDNSTAKPTNASQWYIPSARQVLDIVGGCYGFTTVDGIKAMEKNTKLAAALETVITKKIGTSIGGGKGHYVFNSSLNQNELPEPVAILVDGTGSLLAVKNNRTNIAGYIRPVLTIIK